MTDTARVILWGSNIGSVTWVAERDICVFQYTPEFAESNIQVAPMMMPLDPATFEFPSLNHETFNGLPGMLADSLPDKFGNTLINAWLAGRGRTPDSFTPVERLCYTGTRGIGALEFAPAITDAPTSSNVVDIEALVTLANRVLDERIELSGKLSGDDDAQAIEDILRVGTSAGGARAKAVLSWNEQTGAFHASQAAAESGFSHWLMKFDGVHGNKDKELADPMGYGRIEYAYHLMARAAGIGMEQCRLHEEGDRAHFMTRRFDRTADGDKVHMQSLGAMMHFDFNQAGVYSYEQAIQLIRQLKLPMADVDQQVRRAFFNVLACNHDDHVKNIAFLMNRRGEWRLSPAFDVAYAYNPDGAWTSQHQMSLNGKRRGFGVDDLLEFAAVGGIKKGNARTILQEVSEAMTQWVEFAELAGMAESYAQRIADSFRTNLLV